MPTGVTLAVRRQIDARNLLRTLCFGGVTSPAETAIARLGGTAEARRNLVLLAGFMTPRAGQQGVVRNGLCARDLAMTGAAFSGDVRRLRRVRVVAGDAGLDGIVGDGIDLGKPRRPRRIVPMAQRTVAALPRCRRLVFCRRFHVRRPRPVAGLTGNRLVSRKAVHLYDVCMANRAPLPANVLHVSGHHRINGCGSVVSKSAKRLGHQVMPRCHQAQCHQGKENQESADLLGHCRRRGFGACAPCLTSR